jgi:hypothetical protein
MPTISAAVPTSSLVPGAGPAISTLNGGNTYVSLRYRRLEFLIELVSELSVRGGGRRSIPRTLAMDIRVLMGRTSNDPAHRTD